MIPSKSVVAFCINLRIFSGVYVLTDLEPAP
jgi:hypothetical protein